MKLSVNNKLIVYYLINVSSLSNKSMLRIFGGGILGTLFTIKLSQKFVVELYEQSSNLIPSFNSIKINDYYLNPGHHALEMPRGKDTFEILNLASKYIKLKKKDHLRFICISGEVASFTDTINKLPKILKLDIKSLLNNNPRLINNDQEFRNILMSKDSIYGSSYVACMKRFSDNPKDTWTLFYPWMFPAEFAFKGNDEGDIFRRKVRSLNLNPFIIIPENELFENVANQFSQFLKSKNINLNLNFNSSINLLTSNKNSENKNIWCGPAMALTKEFGKIDGLIKCKRHFYILLFEIIEFKNFLKKYNRFEILFMEPKFYYLNKVSRAYSSSRNLLTAEILLDHKIDNNEMLNMGQNLKIYFENLFKDNLKFIGGKFLRDTYTLDPIRVNEEAEILRRNSIKHNFIIPQISWGPQNLSKAGIITNIYAKEYLS